MSDVAAPPRATVLETRDVVKNYGSVRALRGVNFALAQGEVVGLIGDNGAGKSTFVKVLAGVEPADGGQLFVDGEPLRQQGAVAARGAGIETVFQDLALIPTLDIASNVFLNRELRHASGVRRWLGLMDRRQMRRQVAEGFARLNLALPPPDTRVSALSGGQRQAVAIARAVLWGSHIVIMDEPSAALGVHQTEVVLSFVERLKDHGVAVIFISHNMPQVLRVSDRVVVMRLGQVVADVPAEDSTPEQLVSYMTGAVAQ